MLPSLHVTETHPKPSGTMVSGLLPEVVTESCNDPQPSGGVLFTFSGNDTNKKSECARESIAELRKKYSDLTRKYKRLEMLHNQAKASIRSLKRQVKSGREKLDSMSKIKFLNEDQKKVMTRKTSRGCAWSEKTIRTSLQIKHACGTAGYELLRSLSYPLPSNRTLIRRLQNIHFLPGILHEVFDVLKRKVEAMEDIEKDCVLFMDEMEIAQGYAHDRSLDYLFGSTTLPDTPDKVANHALVFMVGGLNKRYKQVIAYHFTCRSIDGRLLKELVFSLIEMLHNISLRVLVVTSDMGSANRAVWNLLGFSSHRNSETVCSVPHPHLERRRLHFMADPAHVIKNLRAQFLRVKCFYLSNDTVKQQGLPGNKVDITDVEEVLTFDSENDLKIANGLSDVHLSTGHFTKMKVSIAVQLFREAPAGIRYLIRIGKLTAEAESTAWFFELLWKWYSLMSSRHPVLALSKIDVGKYEEAIATLRLAEHTLRHVKMGTANWKPSQAGLLISTTVVLSLAEELLCHRGYMYVLTSRLLQDCLENVFSIVRMKKPTPSAYDVKCALKLVCVGQFLHTPKSTSYDIDDNMHLADLLGPTLQKQLEEFVDDEEHLEDVAIEDVSATECDILAYIGGFLLRAILKAIGDCEPCRAALVGEDERYNALINLKEYVKGAHNLIRPSNAVMAVLVHFEEYFKAIVTADSILDMKAPFRTVSRFLAENVEVNLESVCSSHKEKVEKLLLEKYVRSRLRMHLRQQMARCVEPHSSKTCAGVNLS